jgi:mRNA interferase RelE/StbE
LRDIAKCDILMKAIAFVSSARRDWRALPANVRARLMDALERYAASATGDVTALKGRPGARLRVGDDRIIFVETTDWIEIRAVGHRRDIYG